MFLGEYNGGVSSDIVSGSREPIYEITADDLLQDFFNEYGTEALLIFILGIISGIFISYIYSKIKKAIQSRTQSERETPTKT